MLQLHAMLFMQLAAMAACANSEHSAGSLAVSAVQLHLQASSHESPPTHVVQPLAPLLPAALAAPVAGDVATDCAARGRQSAAAILLEALGQKSDAERATQLLPAATLFLSQVGAHKV